MKYCENWAHVKERHEKYWALENHDSPLITMTVPKDNAAPALRSYHTNHKERWMDTEFTIAHLNHNFENTVRYADTLPLYNPNLGPDYFAACYGVPLEFGETTSWSVHNMTDEDVRKHSEFLLETNNEYRKKMLEITKAVLEDSKGKYIVGITDIHAGADALVAMRSPATLAMDTIDNPEFIKKGIMDLFQGFKEIYGELADMIAEKQQGTSNWMAIWHPKRWYVTSADFAGLISTDMFDEFLEEELSTQLDYLDASIFHLDGPSALKHLDKLLTFDKLRGVQWVYGAGQPTAVQWIDTIKKIQAAGKCVHIDAQLEDMGVLLKEVDPHGILYSVQDVKNEADAEYIMNLVEQYRR